PVRPNSGLPSTVDQVLTFPSPQAAASVLPSGLRAVATSGSAAESSRNGGERGKSQIFAVLSEPPEAINDPSGLTDTPRTSPWWPADPPSVLSSLPFAVSQILRVWSKLPVTTCFPSGVKATA